MEDIQRQIAVLNRILKATDEEVNSLKFWLENVKEYGVYPFQWLVELDKSSYYTENGIMQVQGEIASFCRFLSGQKISSAIEIGVYRGRSSYLICAAIYRSNSDLKYDMVDIKDNLDEFEKFQSVLPCIRKNIPCTSADFTSKKFDFVFIDADHSYEASMLDYRNVGRYARKLVCFHDIYAHEYDAQGGGCTKTWEEICTITPELPKVVFSQFPNRWVGIGVIVNTSSDRKTVGLKNDYEDMANELELFTTAINDKKEIWVYGARNDGRRMYKALKNGGYSVKGLVVIDETEHVEILPKYPVFLLSEVELGNDSVIVVCNRKSLRENVLNKLSELSVRDNNIIVVSDALATFMERE